MSPKSESVTFKHFVKFVKEESDLANDPVFSPDALRKERKLHDRPEFRNKTRYGNQSKGTSFATNTEQNEQYSKHLRLNNNYSNRVEVSKCPACSNGHNLEKCPEFKSKILDQRREFVLSQGLCFGCFKKGHLSSGCKSRMKCGECSKSHPTLLHGIKPIRCSTKQATKQGIKPPAQESPDKDPPTDLDSESANTANVSVCGSSNYTDEDGIITAMLVPVILSNKDRPTVEVCVYALLDDGSNSTFTKESVLKDLGVSGTEVVLKLSTMHGQTSVPVQRINGLVVQKRNTNTTPKGLFQRNNSIKKGADSNS